MTVTRPKAYLEGWAATPWWTHPTMDQDVMLRQRLFALADATRWGPRRSVLLAQSEGGGGPMWLLRLILMAVVMLSPVAATAAEPTEAEMRAVYEERASGLSAEQQDLRQRCERREYRQGQGNPGLAMQCLGTVAGPKGVAVNGFRKIACEKAEGNPVTSAITRCPSTWL